MKMSAKYMKRSKQETELVGVLELVPSPLLTMQRYKTFATQANIVFLVLVSEAHLSVCLPLKSPKRCEH